MLNCTTNVFRCLSPFAYDYFKFNVTYETGKTNLDANLFMNQNPESFAYLARLEWESEKKNRDDL